MFPKKKYGDKNVAKQSSVNFVSNGCVRRAHWYIYTASYEFLFYFFFLKKYSVKK